MNLVLSDRKIELSIDNQLADYINLSELNISNCIGCFGCWTKTPGKCVIRDDAGLINFPYCNFRKKPVILWKERRL